MVFRYGAGCLLDQFWRCASITREYHVAVVFFGDVNKRDLFNRLSLSRLWRRLDLASALLSGVHDPVKASEIRPIFELSMDLRYLLVRHGV